MPQKPGSIPPSPEGKPRKKQRSLFSRIIRAFVATVCLLLLTITAVVSVGGTLLLRDLSAELPPVDAILAYKNSIASVVYDRNKEIIAKLFMENRNPLELRDISPWMVKATLAAEDSSFYQHSGIQISGIIRALWVDIMHQRVRQGGSTITQQLARNLFLTHERTFRRKIKELMLAIRLEKIFSKDTILEKYLNTIYFGHGAWGIDTAAHTYFGKDARDLTLPEAAMLAGILPGPGKYSPLLHFKAAKQRQEYVLDRFVALGWITEEERAKAVDEKLIINHTPNKVAEYNKAPYFLSQILFNDLLPKYGTETVYNGGLEIYTTLDLRLQEEADKAVQTLKTQGALVAMDPATGEILALSGGKDFKESKFNRATQALRQPGSGFKPIIYAAALEQGVLPTDHFLDAPLSFDKKGPNQTVWSPGNYDGKYRGEVTVHDALIHSINTVAVRTAEYIGVEPVVAMARSLGITSPHVPADLSIALGSASVTPLEMSIAFSCFANNGKIVAPLFIREIRSAEGDILETRDPVSTQSVAPGTAAVIRSMMMDVIRAGTGTRAQIPKTESFGKTGTTNDFSDAWFLGGVPGLVAIVYVGNDDHKPLGTKNATGGVLAAPVWKQFIVGAMKYMKIPSKFEVPQDAQVEEVSICRKTGYRAAQGCPAVKILMPANTAPTTVCPLHGGGVTLAETDSHTPRLLLIPQDEALLAQYSSGSGQTTAGLPETLPAKVRQSLEKEAVVPDTSSKPYQNDPSPAQTIEDKYQKLLKQYGINN
jgi:1A family penicillin-binding protein